MHIGVNIGPVVVGAVGYDLHMEYLAIGDSANLAARLQSAAQPGRVLISEATAELVKATFDLEDMGQIEVNGMYP
jgi:class 3 adenylate cyclase